MLTAAIIMLTSCQTKRTYSNDITTLSDQASSTTVVDITKETKVTFAAGGSITWKNHIKLIDPKSPYYCKDFVGGKTGTTDSAGYCLISVFEKNSKEYIIIVTGCKDDNSRCAATLDLYGRIK